MKSLFLRLLDVTDKSSALRELAVPAVTVPGRRFEIDVAKFRAIPQSPFAYWVSERVRNVFSSCAALNGHGRLVVSTSPLNDDFRYVRAWWEAFPATLGKTRRPWAKGGSYAPIYYSIDTVISWDVERATYAGFLGTANRPLERPASVQHFFRPGLTWPRRTNGFSIRVMPRGCIFADKGPALFVADDDFEKLLVFAAVCNSSAFGAFVSLRLARTQLAQSYEVGLIQTVPVPELDESHESVLADLARRAWSLKRNLDTRVEVSHAFVLPALLQMEAGSLIARADAWAGRVRAVEAELDSIQAEIDERCFDLYGIDDADRVAISEGFADDVGGSDSDEYAGGVDEANDEQDAVAAADAADAAGLAAELVSWAVGVAFGRFDVRLATGERELPGEPGPFDALPVCSPGMLVREHGLPSTSAPSGYPVDFPASGVLVDDPGDPHDLAAAVRAVFDAVFEADADRLWDEAAVLLDPRGHDLRAWLRSGFFERHLKLYSKSRRKAPILWQIGTPSGRYSVWLYAHRLTEDSLFQLQSDVLAPKLAYEERQLTNLVQSSGGSPSAKERREIEAQEAFVDELRVLLEEVKRVAPLWKPTLDDGIVLVMAPLWRLVPHKSWQRELKKKWVELADGKYDWAQLAMHLWPERVVPKCAGDRSIAIAHGLEDVFWFEEEHGKWQPCEEPTTNVDDLIQQRTSTAVKDALGVAS